MFNHSKVVASSSGIAEATGGGGVLSIVGGVIKDVARNERVQLEIKGVNNSQITITHGQFGVQR